MPPPHVVNEDYTQLLQSRFELLRQGQFDLAFKYEAAYQIGQANKLRALQLADNPEDEAMIDRKQAIEQRFRQSSFQYLSSYFNAWYNNNAATTRGYAVGYQASLNLAETNEQHLRYFIAFRTEEWEQEISRLKSITGTRGLSGIDFRLSFEEKVVIQTAMKYAGDEERMRCFRTLIFYQRLCDSDMVPDFVYRQLEYVLRDSNIGF